MAKNKNPFIAAIMAEPKPTAGGQGSSDMMGGGMHKMPNSKMMSDAEMQGMMKGKRKKKGLPQKMRLNKRAGKKSAGKKGKLPAGLAAYQAKKKASGY